MMFVIKALGGGIWDLDLRSGALNCSPRWYDILGLDHRTERIDNLEKFKPHIHPDDVDRATRVDFDEVMDLIRQDKAYSIEFRIVHRDGTPRWIRSVATIIPGPGNALRAIGCITNITALMPADSMDAASGLPGGTATTPAATVSRPRSQPLPTLSEHEAECLRWVSFGKTARETATILGRSPRTIEFHLNNAIRKLESVNKVQAAFRAIELGLLGV